MPSTLPLLISLLCAAAAIHGSPAQAQIPIPAPVAEKPFPLPGGLPIPRSDPNSLLAHTQLVAKAKQGGIDVFFAGDSITRRWGTLDAAYADFLANWKSNFHG